MTQAAVNPGCGSGQLLTQLLSAKLETFLSQHAGVEYFHTARSTLYISTTPYSTIYTGMCPQTSRNLDAIVLSSVCQVSQPWLGT